MKTRLLILLLLFLFLGGNLYAQMFYHFDGINDDVSINKNGNGILNDYSSPHDFTVEIRFRFHADPSGRQLVSKQSAPSEGFFLEFPTGTNNLKAGMGWYDSGTLSSNYETITSSPLSMNTWYTAALVYNQSANSFQFYIDGALVGSSSLLYPYAPETTYAIAIGKSLAWGGASPIDVDFFRIWNNQQSQVQLDANEDLEVADNSANLLLQYKFNYTVSPSIVEDSSPNNNDGVANGAIPYTPLASLSTTSATSLAEGTACVGTQDISLDISLDAEPIANTTVTLTTSGAATLGMDYTMSTTSVVFTPANWNTPKTLTLSIARDAVLENDETIIVDIDAVSGSNAVEGSNNQVTFTIEDDEASLNVSGDLSVIMEEGFESGMGSFTSSAVLDGEFTVGTGVTASSSYYIIGASNTSNFAYLNEDVCGCSMTDVKLISPVIDLSGVTGTYMTFDHAFADNFIGFEKFNVVVSTNGGITWSSSIFTITNPGTANNTAPWVYDVNIPLSVYDGEANFRIAFLYEDSNAWTYGTAVDNIRIWGSSEVPAPVQTAVNTSGGYAEHDLGAGDIVHFFDQNTGELMCTIDNSASSHDYGCTRVEVDRAGTSAVEFNSSDVSNYMFSKSLKITPTANTSSDPNGYTITMYYSEAEVSGWEAITGQSRNDIEIHKVDGNNHVYDVTAGNPNGLSITEGMNTSYAAFGSGHSFSTTFTNGFSGFGAGIGGLALPVELTRFQARKDRKTALLTWETASEQNNKGFHIEYSTNGKDFEIIDWVDGNGNTTEVQEYEFTHEKPNTGVNYYRLMQEDFDGTTSYSDVRTVLFDVDLGVRVYPNPSKRKGETNIDFMSKHAQQLNVNVFELNGKQVLSMNYDINEGNSSLSLSNDLLSNGVYIISITHDGGTENVKLSIVE